MDSAIFLFWLQNLCVLLVLLNPSKTSLQADAIFHNWNPKISVNPSSILQPVWYDSDILQASGKVLLFWLNMAWRRLDYCLCHCRVQIALNLQYCPYLRAHPYAHRTEFVFWLPDSACFPACQHRFLATIATHQLEKLSCCPLTGLNLGVSAFAFIKTPLGYPDFFQTALVCDSMLIVVLNYICDFFSCKHFFCVKILRME